LGGGGGPAERIPTRAIRTDCACVTAGKSTARTRAKLAQTDNKLTAGERLIIARAP
jgi:hypothetical protein